jgi:hypothetical protein
MSRSTISALFLIAGVYDFVIGLVFLFFGTQLFDLAGIPYPNHWGYVQFCSLMLMVFGSMFLAIARDPVSNRNLMPFGMLLKISYVGIVCYYWLTTGCPFLFKPFVVIDFVMLVLFAMAFFATAQTRAAVGSPA